MAYRSVSRATRMLYRAFSCSFRFGWNHCAGGDYCPFPPGRDRLCCFFCPSFESCSGSHRSMPAFSGRVDRRAIRYGELLQMTAYRVDVVCIRKTPPTLHLPHMPFAGEEVIGSDFPSYSCHSENSGASYSAVVNRQVRVVVLPARSVTVTSTVCAPTGMGFSGV